MKIKVLISAVCVLASIQTMASDVAFIASEPVSEIRTSLAQQKTDFVADCKDMLDDDAMLEKQVLALPAGSDLKVCKNELKTMRQEYCRIMLGLSDQLIDVVSPKGIEHVLMSVKNEKNSLEVKSEIRKSLLSVISTADKAWDDSIQSHEMVSKCPVIFEDPTSLKQGVLFFTYHLAAEFTKTAVDLSESK